MNEVSVASLRTVLFLLGAIASLVWLRGRPRWALLVLFMAGVLGLSYWLVQIGSPLGLGTDVALTREWCQAGVSATLRSSEAGFILGTRARPSPISALAAAGVPLGILHAAPQAGAFAYLGLMALLPWVLLRSRTTAAFAACLALGGGIWPGASGFDAVLVHPANAAAVALTIAVAAALSRGSRVRRFLKRFRTPLVAVLLAAAIIDRAARGGVNPGLASAWLLVAASIALASPLRAASRLLAPSHAAARRLEAATILFVFGGSGLFWWNPPQSVPIFGASRDPGGALQKPMEWMARNLPNDAVVLASPPYGASIAAMAGRRVLFPPSIETGPSPFLGSARRGSLLESAFAGRPIERLANALSVTHLLLGPGEQIKPPAGLAPEPNEPVLGLDLIYEDDAAFRVFRLAKK